MMIYLIGRCLGGGEYIVPRNGLDAEYTGNRAVWLACPDHRVYVLMWPVPKEMFDWYRGKVGK